MPAKIESALACTNTYNGFPHNVMLMGLPAREHLFPGGLLLGEISYSPKSKDALLVFWRAVKTVGIPAGIQPLAGPGASSKFNLSSICLDFV